jgi:hypothetical protein
MSTAVRMVQLVSGLAGAGPPGGVQPHYQHPRNLRLLQAAQAEPAGAPSVVVVLGRRHGRWCLKRVR